MPVPETPLGAALRNVGARFDQYPNAPIQSPGMIEAGGSAPHVQVYSDMNSMSRPQFMAKWGMTPEDAQRRFPQPGVGVPNR